MTHEPRDIALRYLQSCAKQDLDTVRTLLAPDLRFVGPSRSLDGAAAYLEALRRLGPIWVRSDIEKLFVDGNEVCALYDFVTDTPAGAVKIVEHLRIEDGRITDVTIIFDRVAFQPASEALEERARA